MNLSKKQSFNQGTHTEWLVKDRMKEETNGWLKDWMNQWMHKWRKDWKNE